MKLGPSKPKAPPGKTHTYTVTFWLIINGNFSVAEDDGLDSMISTLNTKDDKKIELERRREERKQVNDIV